MLHVYYLIRARLRMGLDGHVPHRVRSRAYCLSCLGHCSCSAVGGTSQLVRGRVKMRLLEICHKHIAKRTRDDQARAPRHMIPAACIACQRSRARWACAHAWVPSPLTAGSRKGTGGTGPSCALDARERVLAGRAHRMRIPGWDPAAQHSPPKLTGASTTVTLSTGLVFSRPRVRLVPRTN